MYRKRREEGRARRVDLPSRVNKTCIYIIAILFITFNGSDIFPLLSLKIWKFFLLLCIMHIFTSTLREKTRIQENIAASQWFFLLN